MTRYRTRLRMYRRQRGFSQAEVATVLQLKSPAIVSRWERGEQVPSPRRLLELSALYQRLVNDLLRPDYLAARTRVFKIGRSKHLLPR